MKSIMKIEEPLNLKRGEKKRIDKKLKHLWDLVSNTPMIEILYEYDGKRRSIYVKCENYNLTGSIKDRTAVFILQRAYAMGAIKPGNEIVDVSNGNMGISFSCIGKSLGHPVTIIMPNPACKERADIIRGFGANIKTVSKRQFFQYILSIEMPSKDPNAFIPLSFDNACNFQAHQLTTGPEIWMQLDSIGLKPDVFVAGVGTGATIMGINRYFKSKNRYIHSNPIEPLESPMLTAEYIGSHRIQGISSHFIPSIIGLHELAPVLQVSDGDAILMTQKLEKQLGIAVGISSGANILGAINMQEFLRGKGVVVTVFPDSNKNYQSTDLLKEVPVQDHYVSPKVELVDSIPVQRGA